VNQFSRGISTIIFDLGGVIVDLSPQATADAFAALANVPVQQVFKAYTLNPDFNSFEKGELTESDFRNAIRRIFSVEASDAEIDHCWNAMLLGLPSAKLDLLQKLMGDYNTLLLSNTNSIHLDYIEDRMLAKSSLDRFFNKAYYSHKIGMRKPDTEIYQHVLKENKLLPEQTVFMDDNIENILAARSIGIETVHITHPDMIFEIFN
jgi:glucose-1-phosphatase